MTRAELTDLEERVTAYIYLSGVPVNVRHGTNIDIAEWIIKLIDRTGKEIISGEEKSST